MTQINMPGFNSVQPVEHPGAVYQPDNAKKSHRLRNIALFLGIPLVGATAILAGPEILEEVQKVAHSAEIPDLSLNGTEYTAMGGAGDTLSWEYVVDSAEDYIGNNFFIDEFAPDGQYFNVSLNSHGEVKITIVATAEEATHVFSEIEGTGGGVMQLIEH